MFQEGPTSKEKDICTLDSGHLWYVAPSGDMRRSIAFLINKRWSDTEMSFETFGARIAYLDLHIDVMHIRFISAHLPDSGYPVTEYEGTLEMLEVCLLRGTNKICVVGTDANAILGAAGTDDIPHIIGKYGLGDRNERGHLFANWLHSNHMAAVNTFFDKKTDQLWTHKLWASGSPRQIDYLLVTKAHAHNVQDTFVLEDVVENSDHRCVGLRSVLLGTFRAKAKAELPSEMEPFVRRQFPAHCLQRRSDEECTAMGSGDPSILVEGSGPSSPTNSSMCNRRTAAQRRTQEADSGAEAQQ